MNSFELCDIYNHVLSHTEAPDNMYDESSMLEDYSEYDINYQFCLNLVSEMVKNSLDLIDYKERYFLRYKEKEENKMREGFKEFINIILFSQLENFRKNVFEKPIKRKLKKHKDRASRSKNYMRLNSKKKVLKARRVKKKLQNSVKKIKIKKKVKIENQKKPLKIKLLDKFSNKSISISISEEPQRVVLDTWCRKCIKNTTPIILPPVNFYSKK